VEQGTRTIRSTIAGLDTDGFCSYSSSVVGEGDFLVCNYPEDLRLIIAQHENDLQNDVLNASYLYAGEEIDPYGYAFEQGYCNSV
jgi:hypothetical protein